MAQHKIEATEVTKAQVCRSMRSLRSFRLVILVRASYAIVSFIGNALPPIKHAVMDPDALSLNACSHRVHYVTTRPSHLVLIFNSGLIQLRIYDAQNLFRNHSH